MEDDYKFHPLATLYGEGGGEGVSDGFDALFTNI